MSEAPRGLPAAFAEKEQVESLLDNLEKLRTEGSVTEQRYQASRQAYQQRLTVALGEIDRIKSGLSSQLEANQRDVEEYRRELKELEARRETEELSSEDYTNFTEQLRVELEELEQDGQALERLLNARSAEDLRITPARPSTGGPTNQQAQTPPPTPSREETRGASESHSDPDKPHSSSNMRAAGIPAASLGPELKRELHARDEARRLLSSLQGLEADDAITDEDRADLKRDYEKRLVDADASIEALRSSIRDELRSLDAEQEDLQQQQATLEVRHKVGEIDDAAYQKASQPLQRRQAELGRKQTELDLLYSAESESDIVVRPTTLPVHEAPPSVGYRAPARRAPAFLSRLSGRKLPLVVGGLIVVGVIAIAAVLLLAGLAGVIPNPFASDEGGASTPGLQTGEPDSDGASGDTVPVEVEAGDIANAETDFDMPLELRGATDIGSLHAELTYDPAELELLSVTAGALPPDAMFQFGASDGRVALGFVSATGLDGDFAAAVLRFRVLSDTERAGDARFGVENIVAHNAGMLVPVATMPWEGRVNLVSLAVGAAAVDFQ